MRIKKVTQNTRDFNVTDPVFGGGTDLNGETFNGMQDNIETAINDTQNNIPEIVKGTTLWENSNPTVDFTEQLVNVNTSNYNRFYILFRVRADDNTQFGVYVPQKGITCSSLGYAYEPNNQLDVMAWRRVTVNTDNATVYFGNGEAYGVSHSNGYYQQLNNLLIPYKIIGYK